MVSDSEPIVVGVDGSEASLLAVDWATRESSRRGAGVHLLHAWDVDLSSQMLAPLVPAFERQSQLILKTAAARARQAAPGVEISRRHTTTRPAAALISASENADTIVLGSRGLSSLSAVAVGSTSVQVAAHAACPVVVVKEGMRIDRLGAVIVGVDGSDGCQDAVSYAFEQAAAQRTALDVVNTWNVGLVQATLALNAPIQVWEGFEKAEADLIGRSIAPWLDKYPDVPVKTHVSQGPAAVALVRASREARLLVVGTRGRGGFRSLLLGSVSRAVLHGAACPVAVVRATSGSHEE